jgi:hypothetical protein
VGDHQVDEVLDKLPTNSEVKAEELEEKIPSESVQRTVDVIGLGMGNKLGN